MILGIIVLIVTILFVVALARSPITIKSHWQTFLDGFAVPSAELYAAITAGLAERQITKVAVTEESFLESHIISDKRAYLRVTQNEYIFYICAAPYGTGTFISSWLCIKDENFMNKIPILSKLMGKDRNNKTFYQMDTEAMFQEAVHATVLSAVSSMTLAKGMRGFTELEKQFKDFR